MSSGVRGSLRYLFACALVAVAVGAVACGGDDDAASEASDKPKYSAASEPATAFVSRTAKLIETTERAQDCVQANKIYGRSLFRPGCPAPKSFRKSMGSFKLVDSKEYGTGAVIDYTSGSAKDGASIVLFVGPSRAWGISRFGVVTSGTVGTSDATSRNGFDKALAGYLAAVRERDCAAFIEFAATDSQGKKACKKEFALSKPLAKKLKANPRAKPKYQGGNATFGFYTLETAKPKPENATISLVKAPAKAAQPYIVMDVVPSPTTAQQRQVQREFEQQQRKEDRERKKSQPDSAKPAS